MSYKKRTKYCVKDDVITKDNFTKLLLSKGFSKQKAVQLIQYSNPMSLIRWSKYLEISEFDKYLEKAE